MKQATLIFEDRDKLIQAIKGQDYYSCLWNLDQDMRNKLKHGHLLSADEVIEYVRDFISANVDLSEVS